MRQQLQQHTIIRSVAAGFVTTEALALLIALFGSGIVPAQTIHAAASQQLMSPQTATQAAFAAPHEISKTVLSETSIDGPAFWTGNGFGPAVPPVYFLAWTGTDPAHHVNYVAPGLISPKVTMRETSIAHPAAVSGGNIDSIVAWTGTDATHHLNIECVVACDVVTKVKLTLNQTSNAGPALFRSSSSGLLLAWTGTDANHSLNVLHLGIEGTAGHVHWVLGTHVILRQYSSIAGPSLAEFANNLLVLSFILSSGQIGFATSSDGGVRWTTPSTSPLPRLSAATPDMFGSFNAPNDWLTWTGVDSLHHVNVQYTTSFPSWPSAGTRAVLPETALGGPVMGFEQTSSFTGQFVVAWTGTDAAHHINIAVIAV